MIPVSASLAFDTKGSWYQEPHPARRRQLKKKNRFPTLRDGSGQSHSPFGNVAKRARWFIHLDEIGSLLDLSSIPSTWKPLRHAEKGVISLQSTGPRNVSRILCTKCCVFTMPTCRLPPIHGWVPGSPCCVPHSGCCASAFYPRLSCVNAPGQGQANECTLGKRPKEDSNCLIFTVGKPSRGISMLCKSIDFKSYKPVYNHMFFTKEDQV